MTDPTTDARTGRVRSMLRRGLHWPVLIALVFLGNIALAAWVIVVSTNDPSFAVEQNYYDKALNWNDEIDQRKHNKNLGWSITVPDPPRIDAAGRCDLVLRVADDAGEPVTGAEVRMLALPIARAHDRREIALDEVAPGDYAARIENARHGLWQLRLRVTLGEDVFTHTLETVLER